MAHFQWLICSKAFYINLSKSLEAEAMASLLFMYMSK